MQDLVYKGIIIKQANYGDAHRMLWIFTETDGIIKAVRYGIRGKKTSNAAAFQLFSYGDFKLRPSRGDIMTAVSADISDGFYPISEDIKKLALASYLSDVTYTLLGEANPDKRILTMFLNALYALSYRDGDLLKIKSVYELKLMSIGGYMPKLDTIGEYFSIERGTLISREEHIAGNIKIDNELLCVMRYIVACEDRKMLSFKVNEETILKLNRLTEKYVSIHCDTDFKSLAYFYTIIKIQ